MSSLIKVILKKTCCSKNIYCRVLSAPKFYCCIFNDRAVPWLSPFEFVSMQIGVESGVQCITNGAENSTS